MFIPQKSSSVRVIQLPRSHLHQEPLDTAQGWKIPAWKFQKVKTKNRKEGLEEESLGIPQFYYLGGASAWEILGILLLPIHAC